MVPENINQHLSYHTHTQLKICSLEHKTPSVTTFYTVGGGNQIINILSLHNSF